MCLVRVFMEMEQRLVVGGKKGCGFGVFLFVLVLKVCFPVAG